MWTVFYLFYYAYAINVLGVKINKGPKLEIDTDYPFIAFLKTMWYLPKFRAFNLLIKLNKNRLKFKTKNFFILCLFFALNILLSLLTGASIYLIKLSVFIVRFIYCIVFDKKNLKNTLYILLENLK